jgi:hypothetical protein
MKYGTEVMPFKRTSIVTMETKLCTAVNSVKLSEIEFNEVKVSSLKLISIKLGSSTSNELLM